MRLLEVVAVVQQQSSTDSCGSIAFSFNPLLIFLAGQAGKVYYLEEI